MDVGTGLAALGTAQVSKEMIEKILGPTADYVGAGIQAWAERSVHNVQRVFAKANYRLGDGIDKPGAVPPRVLKAVLEEGQFADDQLTVEYLGGVLASSRTENDRDDRAASMAQLITGLSTYALRTHYVFYSAVRRNEFGQDARRWQTGRGLDERRVFIAVSDYVRAMDFTASEIGCYTPIFSDTMLSLRRSDLIGSRWVGGDPEHLRTTVLKKDFPSPGIVLSPTQLGIALFCAVHGVRTDPFVAFVDPDIDMSIEDDDVIEIDGIPVGDLDEYKTSN